MTLDLYTAADQVEEGEKGSFLGTCEGCKIRIVVGDQDVYLDGDRGDYYHKECADQ